MQSATVLQSVIYGSAPEQKMQNTNKDVQLKIQSVALRKHCLA